MLLKLSAVFTVLLIGILTQSSDQATLPAGAVAQSKVVEKTQNGNTVTMKEKISYLLESPNEEQKYAEFEYVNGQLKDDSKKEISQDAPKVEPKKEDPKAEPKKEELKKEESKGEPKEEQKGEPNEEQKGESKKEPSGEPKGEPKEEQKGEPKGEPKEEQKGEPKREPKEEQKEELKKEETKEDSKEEHKGEQKKGKFVKAPDSSKKKKAKENKEKDPKPNEKDSNQSGVSAVDEKEAKDQEGKPAESASTNEQDKTVKTPASAQFLHKPSVSAASPNASSFSIPANRSEEQCLKLDLTMKVFIKYPTSSEGILSEAAFDINPASYEGRCDNSRSGFNQISIWTNLDWTITLFYTKDIFQTNLFKLSSIEILYLVDEANFPNVSSTFLGPQNITYQAPSALTTEIGKSYACDLQEFEAADKSVKFEFRNYRVQAFNSNPEFSQAVNCKGPEASPLKMGLFVGIAGTIVTAAVAFVVKFLRKRPEFEKIRLEPANSRFV